MFEEGLGLGLGLVFQCAPLSINSNFIRRKRIRILEAQSR